VRNAIYFNTAAVNPKVVESILPSGAPQEATMGDLPNVAPALGGSATEGEEGEISFAKDNELVLLNCQDAEAGEAPKTYGNSGPVPFNHSVPPNLCAATSSAPVVVQATATLPYFTDGQAMRESENAEAHKPAAPRGETENFLSMQQPAADARKTHEGTERNNATSARSQICLWLPIKPGAHRATKVSPSLPIKIFYFALPLIHMQTQRLGHGKPLTPEYLSVKPFTELRRMAEQRGIDVGGGKEQLIERLLDTEG